MGGCTTPGPACGETKEPEEGLPGGSLSDARPLSAKTGAGKGVKMTGWPRAIEWKEFRELDKRPDGVKEDAEIHSQNEFTKEITIVREKGKFRLGPISAKVVVVSEDTWVVKGMMADPLLSHEQGHYDITGLVGRDILRALAKIRAPSVKVLKQRVESTTERLAKLATELTEQYDDETNHGLVKAQQRRWKAHIRKCMKNGHKLSAPP